MHISKLMHGRNFFLTLCLTSLLFATAQAQAQIIAPIEKKAITPFFERLGKEVIEPCLKWLEKDVIKPSLQWLDRVAITPGGKWLGEQAGGEVFGEIIAWPYKRCEDLIIPQVDSISGQSVNDYLFTYKTAFIMLLCFGLLVVIWLIQLLWGYIKRKARGAPQI